MQIFNAAILAARFDDLIKILPIFLFLIFWVMGQIAEAKKKARMAKSGQSPATTPAATAASVGGAPRKAVTEWTGVATKIRSVSDGCERGWGPARIKK